MVKRRIYLLLSTFSFVDSSKFCEVVVSINCPYLGFFQTFVDIFFSQLTSPDYCETCHINLKLFYSSMSFHHCFLLIKQTSRITATQMSQFNSNHHICLSLGFSRLESVLSFLYKTCWISLLSFIWHVISNCYWMKNVEQT